MHAAFHGQSRRAEVQRLLKFSREIKRVVLHPEPSGKLPRAREGQLARLVRQRDDRRQRRMRRAARADDATHEWPVIGIRAAVVALLLERLIRHVAGEIVVITRVMIAGRAAEIGNAMHERKAVRLLREQRQMFAKMDVRRGRADRLELATKLARRARLHIPHVDVRCAAAEEKEDRGFRRLARRGRGCGGGLRGVPKVQPREAERRRGEERAPIHRWGEEGGTHRAKIRSALSSARSHRRDTAGDRRDRGA